MPSSFVFDANRCTGCGACRLACTIENSLGPEVSWRRIETFNPRHHPIAPVFHLSIACNHCADAACMNGCPALAYRRDAPTGAVLLDADKCIGCGYCAWACPYDAPVFDESRGVMTKCTWCEHRLRIGLKPACATHCPTGALDYADVPAETQVTGMEGLPVTTLGPSLHVISLQAGRTQPEMVGDVELPSAEPRAPSAEPPASSARISLRREWPLAVFTLAAATLVALAAGAAAGVRVIPPMAFAVAAAAAMALSSAHLGRKDRAWRAILNVRRSWLSREVATLSLFYAAATLWLWLAPGNSAFGWTVVSIGLVGLSSADQLYVTLPAAPGRGHSAGVLWTGIFLMAIAAGEAQLAAIIGLVRLVVYARLRRNAVARGLPFRQALSTARIGLTLAGILALFAPGFPGGAIAAIVLALAGDAVDRCQYYMELERETPRRQMDLALTRRIAARQRAGPGEAVEPVRKPVRV